MRTNQENYEINICDDKTTDIEAKIKNLQKSLSKRFDLNGGCSRRKSAKRKTWKFW